MALLVFEAEQSTSGAHMPHHYSKAVQVLAQFLEQRKSSITISYCDCE